MSDLQGACITVRVTRGALGPPPLARFRRWEVVLGNLLWVPLLGQGFEPDGLQGPRHPQPFCDPVVLAQSKMMLTTEICVVRKNPKYIIQKYTYLSVSISTIK